MPTTNTKPNSTDIRAQALRAVAGLVPGGSIISEYLVNRIPEQRIERVIQYLEQLSQRLDRLEVSVSLNDPRFVELFEDAFDQASRSHSTERTGYLTRIILPNEPTNEAEWQVRRKLLQILRELTDLDIDILIEHLDFESLIKVQRKYQASSSITLQQRKEFSDQQMFAAESRSSYFDMHVATLERLRLLLPVIKKPDFSRMQDLDLSLASAWSRSVDDHGNPIVESHRVTELGRLLIGAITGRYPRTQ